MLVLSTGLDLGMALGVHMTCNELMDVDERVTMPCTMLIAFSLA